MMSWPTVAVRNLMPANILNGDAALFQVLGISDIDIAPHFAAKARHNAPGTTTDAFSEGM